MSALGALIPRIKRDRKILKKYYCEEEKEKKRRRKTVESLTQFGINFANNVVFSQKKFTTAIAIFRRFLSSAPHWRALTRLFSAATTAMASPTAITAMWPMNT